MNQKKCPFCGELVHRNDLTCPKCFKEVPRDQSVDETRYASNKNSREKGKVSGAALLLAIFPPIFGLLGLGIIYKDHKDRNGYWFLIGGLLLFLPSLWILFTMLRSGFFSAVLLFIVLVILTLIYISAAVSAFLETLFGSVFKVLKF
jgi:endogenous inhibitor of DNA gyrase (YacG/DUF329 family)